VRAASLTWRKHPWAAPGHQGLSRPARGASRGDEQEIPRVTGYLREYCEQESLRFVNEISVEKMDGYARWRNKTDWAWIKELEILRQFFNFCIEREWTSRNPAKALKRPRLLEANESSRTRPRRLCASSRRAITSAAIVTNVSRRAPWCS
jgi:hypothetical protein